METSGRARSDAAEAVRCAGAGSSSAPSGCRPRSSGWRRRKMAVGMRETTQTSSPDTRAARRQSRRPMKYWMYSGVTALPSLAPIPPNATARPRFATNHLGMMTPIASPTTADHQHPGQHLEHVELPQRVDLRHQHPDEAQHGEGRDEHPAPSEPVQERAHAQSNGAAQDRADGHCTGVERAAPLELFRDGLEEYAQHGEGLGALREARQRHHGDDNPAVVEGLSLPRGLHGRLDSWGLHAGRVHTRGMVALAVAGCQRGPSPLTASGPCATIRPVNPAEQEDEP